MEQAKERGAVVAVAETATQADVHAADPAAARVGDAVTAQDAKVNHGADTGNC